VLQSNNVITKNNHHKIDKKHQRRWEFVVIHVEESSVPTGILNATGSTREGTYAGRLP
jgi:hypothetical protein